VPGFNAEIRFDQGIKKTLDNILSEPELQREDQEYNEWCDRVIDALERAAQEIKKG
jgi:hypothetical protein